MSFKGLAEPHSIYQCEEFVSYRGANSTRIERFEAKQPIPGGISFAEWQQPAHSTSLLSINQAMGFNFHDQVPV